MFGLIHASYSPLQVLWHFKHRVFLHTVSLHTRWPRHLTLKSKGLTKYLPPPKQYSNRDPHFILKCHTQSHKLSPRVASHFPSSSLVQLVPFLHFPKTLLIDIGNAITQSFITVPALLVNFPQPSSPEHSAHVRLLGRQWPLCWTVGNRLCWQPVRTIYSLKFRSTDSSALSALWGH